MVNFPLRSLVALVLGMGVTSGCASGAGAVQRDAGAGAGEPEITAALRAFVKGGDARDLAAVKAATHDDFRVVFAMKGGDGVVVMSRAQYLGALEAGKIGGGQRALEIEWTRSSDRIAWAKATMRRDDAHFDSLFTLVRGAEGWRVVQDSVVLSKL